MLLNLAYAALLLLVSPWLIYVALRHGKYRRGWAAKLLGRTGFTPPEKPRIWFHAVSVGEVNVLVGLIAELQHRRPDLDWVVSTTTSTGHQLACQRFGTDRVCYCPLDFTWAVRHALANIQPSLIVLAELEIWPNWIAAARRHGVPVAVINGRLSDSSIRGYRRWRRLLHNTFNSLSVAGVQDASYAERFVEMGVSPDRVNVTGSLKFDQAPLEADQATQQHLRTLVGLSPGYPVWVVGSTQSGEEAMALRVFQRIREDHPELRLIIVPRHAERFDEVAACIEQHGFGLRRKSQLETPCDDWPGDQIVLIDTIGELRDWWGLADVAMVGGSFVARGGQNMLEPAAYGAAVCFGPNTRNFRDIVDRLLANDAARRLADETALEAFVREMLANPESARALGDRAREVVASQRGATGRTLDIILPLLPAAQPEAPLPDGS